MLHLAAVAAAGLLATVAVAAAVAAAWLPGAMSLQTLDETLGVPAFEDRGTCELWARNASDPLETVQRTFPCRFAWSFLDHDDGTTRLHEALYDEDRDEVLRIPGLPRGNLEEWYEVRSAMYAGDAYRYTFDPGAGVFAPPPDRHDRVAVGLVTSGGRPDGAPRLLLVRDLVEVGTGRRGGLDAVHWNATYRRAEIVWHGHEQLRSEQQDLWVDRRTGFVLSNRVRVVVEMTPAQLLRATGVPVPGDLGGEPLRMVELTYESTPASTADHAAKVRSFHRLMALAWDGPAIALAAGSGAVVAGVGARRLGSDGPGADRGDA